MYWGWWRGWAGQVVFTSAVCSKTPKVQICPKTLVHDVPVVSESASNWQVLHLVWCSLQEFSKKVKNYSRKSRWFTNHAKDTYFTDHGNIENSFPRTEKYRFTNHGKNKSSFTLHAKQKRPFTRLEKSIGDPLHGLHNPVRIAQFVRL